MGGGQKVGPKEGEKRAPIKQQKNRKKKGLLQNGKENEGYRIYVYVRDRGGGAST